MKMAIERAAACLATAMVCLVAIAAVAGDVVSAAGIAGDGTVPCSDAI